MERWQAMVLIIEQGAIVLLLLWVGMRFGRWSEKRSQLNESTKDLIVELQKHRSSNDMAVNHAATFVNIDREAS